MLVAGGQRYQVTSTGEWPTYFRLRMLTAKADDVIIFEMSINTPERKDVFTGGILKERSAALADVNFESYHGQNHFDRTTSMLTVVVERVLFGTSITYASRQQSFGKVMAKWVWV